MRIRDWSSDVCSSDLSIELGQLLPWLRIATDTMGREHAVLSDGLRHLRIDIMAGSLIHARGAVLLHYEIWGSQTAARRRRTLERFLDLEIGRAACRERVWQYV